MAQEFEFEESPSVQRNGPRCQFCDKVAEYRFDDQDEQHSLHCEDCGFLRCVHCGTLFKRREVTHPIDLGADIGQHYRTYCPCCEDRCAAEDWSPDLELEDHAMYTSTPMRRGKTLRDHARKLLHLEFKTRVGAKVSTVSVIKIDVMPDIEFDALIVVHVYGQRYIGTLLTIGALFFLGGQPWEYTLDVLIAQRLQSTERKRYANFTLFDDGDRDEFAQPSRSKRRW